MFTNLISRQLNNKKGKSIVIAILLLSSIFSVSSTIKAQQTPSQQNFEHLIGLYISNNPSSNMQKNFNAIKEMLDYYNADYAVFNGDITQINETALAKFKMFIYTDSLDDTLNSFQRTEIQKAVWTKGVWFMQFLYWGHTRTYEWDDLLGLNSQLHQIMWNNWTKIFTSSYSSDYYPQIFSGQTDNEVIGKVSVSPVDGVTQYCTANDSSQNTYYYFSSFQNASMLGKIWNLNYFPYNMLHTKSLELAASQCFLTAIDELYNSTYGHGIRMLGNPYIASLMIDDSPGSALYTGDQQTSTMTDLVTIAAQYNVKFTLFGISYYCQSGVIDQSTWKYYQSHSDTLEIACHGWNHTTAVPSFADFYDAENNIHLSQAQMNQLFSNIWNVWDSRSSDAPYAKYILAAPGESFDDLTLSVANQTYYAFLGYHNYQATGYVEKQFPYVESGISLIRRIGIGSPNGLFDNIKLNVRIAIAYGQPVMIYTHPGGQALLRESIQFLNSWLGHPIDYVKASELLQNYVLSTYPTTYDNHISTICPGVKNGDTISIPIRAIYNASCYIDLSSFGLPSSITGDLNYTIVSPFRIKATLNQTKSDSMLVLHYDGQPMTTPSPTPDLTPTPLADTTPSPKITPTFTPQSSPIPQPVLKWLTSNWYTIVGFSTAFLVSLYIAIKRLRLVPLDKSKSY
jgi:hypothetical protein